MAKYEVINLATGASHGKHDTMHAVRALIAFDRIHDRYAINLLDSAGNFLRCLQSVDDYRTDRKFEVHNVKTDEPHGSFDTLDEARGCVAYDRIQNCHEIHKVDLAGNLLRVVQWCTDYLHENETDDRVLQGLGLPNYSEVRC